MMCGVSAILLYAIGLVGAQKRNHRYLWAYGALSIFMMVTSLVFGLVLVVVVMSHRGGAGVNHMAPTVPHYTMQHWPLTQLQNVGMVVKTPVKQHGVYVPELESNTNNNEQAPLLQKPRITFKLDEANNNAKRHDHYERKPQPPVAVADSSSEDDESADECDVKLTPLGYGVLALAGLLSLFLFALKVKSICLAFQMRRMLLALANQRLPVTITAPQSSSCCPAKSCPTPAPMTRRECERCTFVNASGVSRCAMCDSPLSFVQAPINVVAPVPRVYAPGSMYPLNNPIN